MKNFFKIVGATFVALLLFFGIMVGLSMCSMASFVAMSDQETVVEDNSVLRVKLNTSIVERTSNTEMNILMDALNDVEPSLSITTLRKAFERAAENQDKIKAVYLECDLLSASPATVEEVRGIITKFKSEAPDVKIVAYADSYSQSSYWLATLADSIFINPHGTLGLTGVTAGSVFFTKALDKLGIEMQIFKVGTFKSAVEPYILNEMSDANRLQMQAMVNGIWHEMSSSMAQSRGIDSAVYDEFVNKAGFLQPTELALEMGLVDGLRYRTDVEDYLRHLPQMNGKSSSKLKYISVQNICKVSSQKKEGKNRIAVLYALGGIDDNSSDGMESNKIADRLNRLAKDDKIDAVVLRVNSPGGSAFGSEQMWDAARRVKAEKPLVVSMSDYAASGGYYISCVADCIVAQPTTLTGSIGIFGMLPNVEGLTEKIGVSFDGVKSHNFADFGDVSRPMTDTERAVMQRNINRGYELFVGRCADGRHTTPDSIKSVAEGRVWLGAQAHNMGVQLVDTLGGLDLAIAIAAKKAGLDYGDFKIVEYPKPKDVYRDLLDRLSGSLTSLSAPRGIDAYLYQQYRKVMGHTGVQALMPYTVTL